jgi:predicted RNA methylase
VSRELIGAGPEAAPALVEALVSGPPAVRKSAAYLLGQHRRSTEAPPALGRAVVEDAEPKVRQNAAVSLGKIGAPETVGALAAALEREEVGWVRSSLILALGAVGGEAACAALQTVSPRDEREQEALRKALDRCLPRRQVVDWRREQPWKLGVLLEVPPGLEEISLAEAAERGFPAIASEGPGLLRCPPGLPPWELLPALRCVYGLLLEAGEGPPLAFDAPAEDARALAGLIAGSAALRAWRDWLTADEGVFRYRFSLDRPLRRDRLRSVLEVVREACLPLGLVDSPSNYDIELTVQTEAPATRLLIRPSFMKDTRFLYRQKDVGASIHPVVAACLARRVRSPRTAIVFDPTCGSGTLLIERALLDPKVRLIGQDISRTAVAAAKTNVKAARLAARIRILKGDATQLETWPRCDEVLANLPFGLRTRREEMDLAQLYSALLAHLAVRLRPAGRALLYTANRKTFEASLARYRNRFQVEEPIRVQAGGIWIHLWVLTPRHQAGDPSEDPHGHPRDRAGKPHAGRQLQSRLPPGSGDRRG